jgi:hypothetical protein
VHRDPSRLPRKGIPRSGRLADQRTLDSNEHETPLTVSKGQWDTHGSPKESQEPGLEAGIEQTIKESIRETLAASREWVLEEIAVFAAHCFIPGAGHVVLLIFDVKDLLEDAAALTSSDRPVELHIPLVHLPPGVELEAGMGLSPQEGKDGPQLFLFLAPGDGGVLGGWALEREADEAYEERREQEQDEPGVCAVIRADLSSVRDRSQDPRELAAIFGRQRRGFSLRYERWRDTAGRPSLRSTTSRPIWVCGSPGQGALRTP